MDFRPKRFLWAFLLFILTLCANSTIFPSKALAFNENFSLDCFDEDVWISEENEGTINFSDGKIILSGNFTSTFPFIKTNNNPIPTDGDYSIKFKIKYNSVTTKGTGVSFGIENPPNGGADPPTSDPEFSRRYLFGIWQDLYGKLYFQFSGECYNQDCSSTKLKKWETSSIDLEEHEIQVTYINNIYKVIIDKDEVFVSDPINIRPSTIWFGNPSVQGSGDAWTGFSIDYIIVSSINQVTFLPGMMTCWNGKALINGIESDNWLLPIWSKPYYQNLIDSFENAGFEEGKGFHLYCYDWRKPLEDNIETLNQYIESNTDPSEKINLVGHSMGGLISRLYSQEYPEKVNKSVMLGSPSQGALKSYPLWEGGQLWEASKLDQLIFKTYLKVNNQNSEHPVHTIRREVQSIQDLLPTFNFLEEKKSGSLKDVTTHIWQNLTMNDFNSSFSADKKALNNIVYGSGFNTLEKIKIYSKHTPVANWVHYVKGLWEDGEPIHKCSGPLCEYTDHNKDYSDSKIYSSKGDSTVLATSANIDGVIAYEVPVQHSLMAADKTSIEKIFEILDISGEAETSIIQNFQKAISFLVRSPANIMITAPDDKQIGHNASGDSIPYGFYDDEANFIVIPDYLTGLYQIKVTGTDNGRYRLMLSRVNTDNEVDIVEYYLNTAEGEVDEYLFDPENQTLQLIDTSGQITFESAHQKITTIAPQMNHFCSEQTLMLLNKAQEKSESGKNQQSASLIKATFLIYNRCYFKMPRKDILASMELYHSTSQDLKYLYDLFSKHSLAEKYVKKIIKKQEKALKKIDKYFEKRIKKDRPVTEFQATLFQEAVLLLNQAEQLLKEGKTSQAYLTSIQINFFLSKL